MKECQKNYSNVFYIPHFNSIGGVETYAYEMAKKYKDRDITFIYSYDSNDKNQIARLRKYARVIKEKPGEIYKCKNLFLSYNAKMDIFKAENIYYIIHANYKVQGLKPIKNDKITEYYGVSKWVANDYSDLINQEVKVAYNPITIEKPRKVLKLISATRLTKEKGKDRMIKLGKELNKAGIPYIWLIFTNDKKEIDNENIVYMNPRLDIRNYIAEADYLVQLSDTEGFSYSVLESMLLGTPVITTPIPSFKEMGVIGYTINYDMKNIPIDDIYNKIPKVENFKAPKDIYDKLLDKTKSNYDPNKKVKVIAKRNFDDIEEHTKRKIGDTWEVDIARYEYLKELRLIK
jgi:glycosyltransferase involved in cell wall biosynthesis